MLQANCIINVGQSWPHFSWPTLYTVALLFRK